MEISFEIEQFSDYAMITTLGDRNSGSDYISAALMLNETIVKSGKKFILTDYRKVKFNLSMTEAFNIVRLYERKLPELKDITMVALINPQTREFGERWEEVSNKKGFNFKVLEDIEEAKGWLMEMRNKSK